MRLTILLILACLAGLTNLAAGAARGMADPAGRMVLCTGTGPVMVYVDEAGAPTGPPVLCPDGVAALFHVALAIPPAPAPVLREVRLARIPHRSLLPLSVPVEGRARSPPGAA